MREWLQGRVGRLLLATLLLSAAVALTGACGGRERRVFADYCGSRSSGVYAHRYACDVCPHRGSDSHANANAYTCTYTDSDALRRHSLPVPIPTPTPTSTPEPTPTAEPTPTPDPTRSSSDSSGGELLDLDEDTLHGRMCMIRPIVFGTIVYP